MVITFLKVFFYLFANKRLNKKILTSCDLKMNQIHVIEMTNHV